MRDRNESVTAAAGPVDLFLRPRSIAVIGVSAKPGSAGRTVLTNIVQSEFAGDLHIVGRADEIDGRAVLHSIDDLPAGVDLAIFTLPAAGVAEALRACGRRGVRAATIFASGFAETGNRAAQDELVGVARAANIAMLGPNCLGYSNLVDGFSVSFANPRRTTRLPAGRRDPAIAMVSQSGGLMAYVRVTLEARNLPFAYTISTGNEAGIGFADFVDHLADDPVAAVILLYLEEVRDPAAFLAACRRARARGKIVVMIHPGKSAKGRAAVQSHTGALAGDHATMRVHLERAGVVLVETMEEMVDVAEILARFPEPPVNGPGIVTFSGGFCAIAHDFCDDIGLDVPSLSPETVEALAPSLPAFIPPRNPLDLGTQVLWQPELTALGTAALFDDSALGSVVVAISGGSPASQRSYGGHFIAAMKGQKKPSVFAMPSTALDPGFAEAIAENRIIFSRSHESALRAVARVTAYGRALQRSRRSVSHAPFAALPPLGRGAQPEWIGKRLLTAIGIAVPEGALATSLDEAEKIAERIGFPLALKGQAAALTHKTEAGAVLLGIADRSALANGWSQIRANVAAAGDVTLDGILVERMAPPGIELMIGARRDPRWGAILMVGLGGIWVEAIGDVRLLPPDLAEEDIVAELDKLRGARLLAGFRGAPPADIAAVARAVSAVGWLMETTPEILEIDINPLFAHESGVTAADALIITAA